MKKNRDIYLSEEGLKEKSIKYENLGKPPFADMINFFTYIFIPKSFTMLGLSNSAMRAASL